MPCVEDHDLRNFIEELEQDTGLAQTHNTQWNDMNMFLLSAAGSECSETPMDFDFDAAAFCLLEWSSGLPSFDRCRSSLHIPHFCHFVSRHLCIS